MTAATPEGLASASANLIRLDPPPSEADIDDVLDRMAAAFGADTSTRDEARRLLHARFAIRMDLGNTLQSSEEHLPWVDARRAAVDPFYWNRYREFLLMRGWAPRVTATLGRAADELLDLLGNPADEGTWQRRGLVMGDVQSGKTASYAALICKAADAGYRMVILLTGTLEIIRRQTQGRLDEAFIGFDSRDYLDDAQARHKRHLGVGLIDGRRDGVVFTSHQNDFRKNAASALNISLAAVNEPVLVVTKKNKAVLERLYAWLRARNADRNGKIDTPLLMIDDEADNASINTRSNPTETTAINKAIRGLLGLFRRASYVGFTATPFANIFIDPSSTSEMLGDDLFPRHFIHVLEAPSNYCGMRVFFPAGDPDQPPEVASEFGPHHYLRQIPEEEDWLPSTHKKDSEPGPIPASLAAALRCFLLTCAVRDLREPNAPSAARPGCAHRSMLVNVSRFTNVQNRVAEEIHLELENIRRAVRLYGALPSDQAAAQSPEVKALAADFKTEFSVTGLPWPRILTALHDAIAPVRVQAVNQTTGAGSLEYGPADQLPGVRVIAVGGNSLSRGLTLEGLSVSYFTRAARAYDTLLQMGRWFGYRDGYLDLCRLWVTEEIAGWYRHVTAATDELKRDFMRMKGRKATPREFGLRVRTHPGTLLITARNKMATGLNVDASWDISLIGRGIESARLYSDRARNDENLQHVERFFESLVSSWGPAVESPHGGSVLWSDISADAVADFLERFLVHPGNYDFQGDSIATFLRNAQAREDRLLSSWMVALPTAGRGGQVLLRALPGTSIRAGLRKMTENKEDGSLLVSGKGARVGGRPDLRHAFAVEEYREINAEPSRAEEDTLRQRMKQPLLLVYLLNRASLSSAVDAGTPADDPGRRVYPAVGLHLPGTRDPDAPRNLVRYRLNRVAQRELLPSDPDDQAETDQDDTED